MSARRSRPSLSAMFSHLGVILALSVVMGILVAGLALPVVGAVGLGAKNTAVSMKQLPEELKTEPLPQTTRVLGRNGQVIASFYDQNRTVVPLDQVAPIMRRAILSIEDYRFYRHGALDLKGTARAFITNQTSDGAGTQGGSSITQQLAKMTAVTQATTPSARRAATADTYYRKLTELRHAIAFEENYSKNWILERYLNTAYFGEGAYGIQAAARHYFAIDASQLGPSQSAFLAGMVKNPVGYSPAQYPQRALARRNVVLARMAQLKVIPQAQADTLMQTRLGLRRTSSVNGCLGSAAPFFCDYVRRYLLADPSLGKTVQDRADLINRGGLTIKTTVDLRYQQAAEQAAQDAVHPTDQAIGALAMVQPGTGEVLGLGQSRPMGRDRDKGETFLDYIVNSKYGDSAGFQAGSTFKVFVLATALEQGLPPSTSFNSPHQISLVKDSFEDCNGPYPDTGVWSPQNSTSDGYFDMAKATQLSVNTYFAQLERKTGLCEPYDLAKKMGVELTNPSTERVPSFTLGVADVSPLEMAGAYATFAARGLHCDNRPVTQVLDSAGKVLKNYPARCQQVMQQSTADEVNSILEGVMAPGGFGQNLTLSRPSAGKTGTTSENVAVWFDGYTPSVATSAMIAGANSVGHPTTLNGTYVGGTYIDRAHGSTVAGPMWADAMRSVEDLMPYLQFGETPPDLPADQQPTPSESPTSTSTP